MRKTFKAASIIFVILIVLFIGMSYFIGSQVFMGSTQLVSNEETTGVSDSFWEEYGMDYNEFCQKYSIERIEITSSFDGHIIPADYIFAEQGEKSENNKTVVLVHGLGGNRYTNYPIAEMFLDQGYNILTYDQRSSNENTAQYTTFGYFEKYDLIDCIHYVKEKAPEQIIGVWGTSFGGATASLALGYEDTQELVDFLILDCPVSSMQWMVEEEMKKMNTGIPVSYMTWCGNIVTKIKLGFDYSDVDAGNAMGSVEIPVLIMNSKADTVTPYFMGKGIYDSIQGSNKEIWTVEDSEHAEMWIDHNQEYREKVLAVLSDVEKAD